MIVFNIYGNFILHSQNKVINFKQKNMPTDVNGPSPEEMGIEPKAKEIIDELFDKTKRGFGDWWQNQPDPERIKNLVKQRIGDNKQPNDDTLKQDSSPGSMYMLKERQAIQELTKKIIEIVNRVTQSTLEFDDRNTAITEEVYDKKIFPKISRELERHGIAMTEGSDALILLEKMKELFIGLCYNDLRAGDEVYEIAYRKTHK